MAGEEGDGVGGHANVSLDGRVVELLVQLRYLEVREVEQCWDMKIRIRRATVRLGVDEDHLAQIWRSLASAMCLYE